MKFFKVLSLYALTIYDLKAKQILWRIYKIILPSQTYYIPVQSKSKYVAFKTLCLNKRNSLINNNQFSFLNIKKNIPTNINLIDFKIDLLWLYNLNYFDFLNSEGDLEHRKNVILFVNRWLKEAQSQDYRGWDSYPTSLRVVNLIKWLISNQYQNHNLMQSICNQVEKIFNNIEWHIHGNHLIANAKALIFAGVYFSGDYANKWKSKGIELLENQLKEQIFPDGGHFEKSPMYHSIILEDILDIINIIDNQSDKTIKKLKFSLIKYATKMVKWLFLMTHPSGELSFFNDTTNGIAPSFIKLRNYAKKLGINIILKRNKKLNMNVLKKSGFINVNNNKFQSILDVGTIGPKYIPGHAHADSLSFEVSLKKKKIIVNSGISTYETSAQRLYERGTDAHSTVNVDKKNSSQVWSSFRVAQKAKIVDLKYNKSKDKFYVNASHDGYSQLFKTNIHTRNWIFENNSIIIMDDLSDKGSNGLANFILHPEVKIKRTGRTLNLLIENQIINFHVNSQDFQINKKFYFPCFNRKILTNCISIKLTNGKSKVTLSWN